VTEREAIVLTNYGLVLTTWETYRAGCVCGWTAKTTTSRREVAEGQYQAHVMGVHRRDG
jgi:hypothetical protein